MRATFREEIGSDKYQSIEVDIDAVPSKGETVFIPRKDSPFWYGEFIVLDVAWTVNQTQQLAVVKLIPKHPDLIDSGEDEIRGH